MREFNEFAEYTDLMNPEYLYDDFITLEASLYGADISGTTYLDKAVEIIEEKAGPGIENINDKKLHSICNKVLFPNNVQTDLVSGSKIQNVVTEEEMVDMAGSYFEMMQEMDAIEETEVDNMYIEDYDDLTERDVEPPEEDEEVEVSSVEYDEDIDPDMSDIEDAEDELTDSGDDEVFDESEAYFDYCEPYVEPETALYEYDDIFYEDTLEDEFDEEVESTDDGTGISDYETEYDDETNEEVIANPITNKVYQSNDVMSSDDGTGISDYETEYDDDEVIDDGDDDEDEYVEYEIDSDDDIDDVYDDAYDADDEF